MTKSQIESDRILQSIILAAKRAQQDVSVNDTSGTCSLYHEGVLKEANKRIHSIAKLHFETGEFDGATWTKYDPECDEVLTWGEFIGHQAAEQIYIEAFNLVAPEIEECDNGHQFTGDSCPDCEDKRFQHEHRRGAF